MPDDFEDIARQLRQGPGRDMRAEAAADEELTELQRRRQMDLAGAARTAMHRGDVVTASVAGLTLSHPVIAVGDDYLTMEDGERWIDLRLIDTVLTITPRPSGGRSGRPSAATFRARIAELEQEGIEVGLLLRWGDQWEGRLLVIGADHVLVASDSRDSYIPLGSIVVVFSRFPPRRS